MKVNKLNINKTILDKAIRLVEGAIVDIDSDRFRLKQFPEDYDGETCFECDLDSICQMEHMAICAECEYILRRRCQLQLANGEK